MMPLAQMAALPTQVQPQHAPAPAAYVPLAAAQHNISRPVGDTQAARHTQNNTSGSSSSRSLGQASSTTLTSISASALFIAPIPAALNGTGSISPLFLAQLLGQGLDVEAQGIIVDYEALMAPQTQQPAAGQDDPPAADLQKTFQTLLTEELPVSTRPGQHLPVNATPQPSAEAGKTLATLFPVTVSTTTLRTPDAEGERNAVKTHGKSLGRPPRTLVMHQGFLAYFATAVRNVVELDISTVPEALA